MTNGELKILNIITDAKIGGRERQLLILARAFAARGSIDFDVCFVKPKGPFYSAFVDLGVVVRKEPAPAWKPGFWVDLYNLFEPYHLVLFWGANYRYFYAALMFGKPRIFVMTGVRGVLSKSFWGVLRTVFGFRPKDRGEAEPVAPGSGSGPAGHLFSAARRFAALWLLRGMMRRSNLVVTPTEDLKRFVANYHRLPPGSVCVVHNFVDPKSISVDQPAAQIRRELKVHPSEMLVGTVARFDRRKRLDRLIRAMADLPRNIPVSLLLIGGGDDAIDTELRRLAVESGSNEKIIFCGFKEDVYSYVNAMDLFVLPSESEGLPMVLLEAMVLKTPVVVFEEAGGVNEIVYPGYNGFVLRHENQLARVITRVYEKRDDMERIVNHGAETVEQNFSAEAGVKDYSCLFDRVLTGAER